MFIEISAGFSINVKHIQAIDRLDDLTCMVYTSNRTFKIAMPSDVVVKMVESRLDGDNSSTKVDKVAKLLTQLYSTQSTPRP